MLAFLSFSNVLVKKLKCKLWFPLPKISNFFEKHPVATLKQTIWVSSTSRTILHVRKHYISIKIYPLPISIYYIVPISEPIYYIPISGNVLGISFLWLCADFKHFLANLTLRYKTTDDWTFAVMLPFCEKFPCVRYLLLFLWKKWLKFEFIPSSTFLMIYSWLCILHLSLIFLVHWKF